MLNQAIMNRSKNHEGGIIGNKGIKQSYRQREARLFDYAQRMGTETVLRDCLSFDMHEDSKILI